MTTPAFSVVQTARTAIEADVLISALRSAGLNPLDLNTASNISLGGTDIAYRVQVPTEELTAARELLASEPSSTATV